MFLLVFQGASYEPQGVSTFNWGNFAWLATKLTRPCIYRSKLHFTEYRTFGTSWFPTWITKDKNISYHISVFSLLPYVMTPWQGIIFHITGPFWRPLAWANDTYQALEKNGRLAGDWGCHNAQLTKLQWLCVPLNVNDVYLLHTLTAVYREWNL